MEFKKGIFVLLAAVMVLTIVPAAAASGVEEGDDILYKNNFGGSDNDHFFSVTAAPDGVVAVGNSYSGGSSMDAIIARFDNGGNVVWKRTFGGDGGDYFYSVAAVSDGFVAVGYSQDFGTGDWKNVKGKGGSDTTLVKFDNNGNVVWKKNFGGEGIDNFCSVAAVPGGFIAAGYSNEFSFGNEDWAGTRANGDVDAILVRFDSNGDAVWKKNLGGAEIDRFYSVTVAADGFIAVGNSNSLGSGDWVGFDKKGGFDAIAVKYDEDGDVVWKKSLGGAGWDGYFSVTAVSDGFIAAGVSWAGSFGNGDWTGVKGKGTTDAVLVKYDGKGNVVWKKNFGGEGANEFLSVTAVSDGVAAVGSSSSFGSGDWFGFDGRGGNDAIIVKYDSEGEVAWKRNFGGPGDETYEASTASSGGIVAVGSSSNVSNSGDWTGLFSKGKDDAIIVKHSLTILPFFIDIVGVPEKAVAGKDLALTGTVVSSETRGNTIVWSVKDAGTTGASLAGNILSTTGEGTAEITATVKDGIGAGRDYAKDFEITVLSSAQDSSDPGILLWIGIVAAAFVICAAGSAVVIRGRNR